MINKSPVLLLVLLFFLYLIDIRPSYAYFDPGSTSYLIKMLMASLIAFSYSIILRWAQLKNFFKKIFSKKKTK
jgi:putative effector of murein hydrolase